MSVLLSDTPNERSSMKYAFRFAVASGVEYTVDQLNNANWQLSKADGTIVNDRTFALNTIPSSGLVHIYDDDLAIDEDETCTERRLAIAFEYDTEDQDGVTGTEEFIFYIKPAVNIQ